MGVAKLSAEQLRNRELERELAIAREVRDILKKATAHARGRGVCGAHKIQAGSIWQQSKICTLVKLQAGRWTSGDQVTCLRCITLSLLA